MSKTKVIAGTMPDELYACHEFRRLGAGDSCNRRNQYRDLLREYGEAIGPVKKKSAMALLAASCGIEHQRYAAQHTMLPVLRVAEYERSDEATARMGWMSQTFHHAATLPSGEARLCLECIDRDCRKDYFSWFRRTHHFAAVPRCPEHGCLLWRILSNNPFSRLPHQWAARNLIEQLPDVRVTDQDSTWYSRYVGVSIGLLSRELPVPSHRLNAVLSSTSSLKGFRTKIDSSEPLLSVRLSELGGSDWVQRHVSSLRNSQIGSWTPTIDGLGASLHFSRPGYLYAMILAVLFDSTTDALEAVNQCGAQWHC